MKTLKKLDPMSMGKVYAVIMGIVNLLGGLIVLLFSSFLGEYVQMLGPAASVVLGQGNAVMVLVQMVIGGIIGGFITGIVGAFIYNLVVGWVGGIKVELE